MKRFQMATAVFVGILLAILIGVIVFRLAVPGDVLAIGALAERFNIEPIPTRVVVNCAQADTNTYIKATDNLMREWDDAIQLAASTSRIALSPAVNSLQTLRRDASDISVPQCAEYLQEIQATFMEYEIQSFLLFMQEADDTQVQGPVNGAQRAHLAFEQEFAHFRDDPLGAYTAALEWMELAGKFQLRQDWWTAHLFNGISDVISLPEGWTNPPSDNMYHTKFVDPLGLLTLDIKADSENTLSDIEMPLLDKVLRESVVASVGGSLDATYVKFGTNTGYLTGAPYIKNGRHRTGFLRTPGGSVYAFDAIKLKESISEQEENTIYNILASIRSQPE